MFISFEGADGTGKTTQIERLRKRCEGEGFHVLVTREPGGTPAAESIRHVILNDWEEEIFGETELFLYAAARCQHLRNVIRPALQAGKIVISDRFLDSSLVYQGIGRGLGKELVWQVNRLATDGILPDLTFILDMDLEESGRRMNNRLTGADRLEKENSIFLHRIRQGYLELAREEPDRCRIINAARPAGEISEEIWAILRRALEGESS